MNAEHRRPFVAFALVAVGCALGLSGVQPQVPSQLAAAERESPVRAAYSPGDQELIHVSAAELLVKRVQTAAQVAPEPDVPVAMSATGPAARGDVTPSVDRDPGPTTGSRGEAPDATTAPTQGATRPEVHRSSGPTALEPTRDQAEPGPATGPAHGSTDRPTGPPSHAKRSGPPEHAKAKGHGKSGAKDHAKGPSKGHSKGHSKGKRPARR